VGRAGALIANLETNSSPLSETSLIASPPLPPEPCLHLDSRGGRVRAKLYDRSSSLPYPSPRPDQTDLFEQGQLDRQNVVLICVPARVDPLQVTTERCSPS